MAPHVHKGKGKGKAIPLEVWTGPEGSRRLRLSEYLDNQHMKAAFTPLPPTPQRKYSWYSFLSEAESNPGP